MILVLFLARLSAGVFAVWLPGYFSVSNDYQSLQHEGLIEYKILLSDPQAFILDIFQSKYENGYGGFFSTNQSFWNDLRTTLITKLLGICNVFSRGFIYTNTLFFNILGILGPVAFFRVFTNIFPEKKSGIIIGCFLLPSTIFFTSALHKDLIVFTFLGLLVYTIYFSLIEGVSFKRLMLIIFSLLMLLFMRNFLFIAILPALFAWILSNTFRNIPPHKIFIFTYSSLMVLFFLVPLFFPHLQVLEIITRRHDDFMKLEKAASQLPTIYLQPTVGSFISNLPRAINHGFARPYVWDHGGRFTPYWSVELLFYFIITVIAVFRRNIQSIFLNRFLLFCVFFSFTMFLLTGYIVPNSGSIIRYKCIYLPLVITPLLTAAFSRKQNI